MRKLALGALVIAALAACSSKKNPILTDAPSGSDAAGVCNVLAQMGCMSGQQCTWIIDMVTGSGSSATSLGHIGCAPDGTMAVGAACTRNPPGAMGYDNCVPGAYCFGPDAGGAGVCKQICDQDGGSPMCATTGGSANLGFACSTYDGLFGPAGMAVAAGVCDPACDGLADNDFLFTGSDTGSDKSGHGYSASTGNVCAATEGCYGFPDSTGSGTTQFSCSTECSGTGSDCDLVQYSTLAEASAFLNSCSQGYLPLLYDDSGHVNVDCIGYCAPADCYGSGGTTNPTASCGSGNSGNLIGNTATGSNYHQCESADMRGTLTPSTLGSAGVNNTHCIYSWQYEIDGSGNFYPSPTSNKIGFCLNNTPTPGLGCQWDPTGGSNANTICPKCDELPFDGSGTPIAGCTPATGGGDLGSSACYSQNAGFWGCLNSCEALGSAGSDGASCTVPAVEPAYKKAIHSVHMNNGRMMYSSPRKHM